MQGRRMHRGCQKEEAEDVGMGMGKKRWSEDHTCIQRQIEVLKVRLKKIETGRKARDSDRVSSALGLNSPTSLDKVIRQEAIFSSADVCPAEIPHAFLENVFPFLWWLSHTWKRKIFFPG